MRKIAQIHHYRGWNAGSGQCGLEIFEPRDGVPVIVLTELPWNTNTSVTNMIEILAAEVALEYLPDRRRSRPAFRVIEHLYEWLTGEDLFELITFALPWPALKKNLDRATLGAPRWRRLKRQEVLIGEPYVECFRRFRQVPPPSSATIEAVRLLRTHLGQIAKCHGPLAAALSRTDLPVVDPPESAGQLYVTGLAQWLFFPEKEHGVKLLSDEMVASHWDVWEISRQLLLSVRQISEIFLTHLELVRDRAGFASALVNYFAHPEKLTVEIIESQTEHSKLWSTANRYETTPWKITEHQLRYGPWEEIHAQEA
ncbi:MAG TPA: hypothetical protein VFZ08_03530 [Terriglobia bacterium]|nr:hypothetical protein [Terriglobia bacterium]